MTSARELFEALVGRRTGIVRDVALADVIDGDAPLFHAGAEIANARPELGGEHLRVGGAGVTRDDAVARALCEAVERYAASSYVPDGGMLQSWRALGDRALRPSRFARYSERQRAEPWFPFARATDDTPFRWVSGVDLATHEPCWVPAFSVYMPYVPSTSDEPIVDVSLSTGLACAATWGEAVEKAAREVIERDAIALLWLRGLSPPRVNEADVAELCEGLLPPRDVCTAFDVTTDLGVPVFFIVCVGEGPRGSIVSVGAACDPDPVRALRKAALEASQDRVYVRLLVEQDPTWEPSSGFGNVTDFSLHARLYSSRPALARRALAFFAGGPTTPLVRTPGEPAARALATRKLRAISVDLTPAWAVPLGLHVARVVIPDLVPLHGSHLLRYEGHERLADAARAMPRAEQRHELPSWPYPHAMP